MVSCLGHVAGDHDVTVLRDGAAALVAAMTSAGVSRLVAVSAAGAFVAGEGKAGYRSGLDVAVRWHYSTTFDTVGRAAVDALSKPGWAGHAVFITE